MRLRPLAMAAIVLAAAGCTNGEGDAGSDPIGDTGSSVADVTTTTIPAVLIGLTPDLALLPDQCWAPIPEPDETTTTIPPDPEADIDDTTPLVTEATTPATLPDPVSTVPAPPVIGIVDCAGTHDGRAFAVFCLGSDPESSEDPAPLTAIACLPADQAEELAWPGDRVVRRTAARICLQRFEETMGEPYALSELTAREFTPTEGVWDRGERRVVCTVDAGETID